MKLAAPFSTAKDFATYEMDCCVTDQLTAPSNRPRNTPSKAGDAHPLPHHTIECIQNITESSTFAIIHCLTKCVKVTFFAGKALKPAPSGSTPKSGEARWIDIHEGEFDEKQMTAWVKQAAKLPGWTP